MRLRYGDVWIDKLDRAKLMVIGPAGPRLVSLLIIAEEDNPDDVGYVLPLSEKALLDYYDPFPRSRYP